MVLGMWLRAPEYCYTDSEIFSYVMRWGLHQINYREEIEERLTRMGYKCTGETVDRGDDITFTKVMLEDNTLAAILVAYPYDQLRPPRKLQTNTIHF